MLASIPTLHNVSHDMQKERQYNNQNTMCLSHTFISQGYLQEYGTTAKGSVADVHVREFLNGLPGDVAVWADGWKMWKATATH